ncbi:MAG: hypothetical protein HYX68_13160 [Planctomycetes bacterium]|nr:hypothetical protein [Planctomycetota bacterium]
MLPNQSNSPPAPETSTSSINLAALFGAVLFICMFAAVGIYAWRAGAGPTCWGGYEESEAPPGDHQLGDYHKWPKPAVTLVLTGQMFGYTDPCGCSEPQYGGLIRRYNFIQSLNARKWNVVGIDLGELPQPKGIQAQSLRKFELSVKSLAAMNYRAFGLGRGEILMPLPDALALVWDKKRPYPRPINTTLAQTAKGEFYHELNVRPFELIDTTPRIGVINLLGQDLRDELANRDKFLTNLKALPDALNALAKANVEFGIILHHENPKLDVKTFPEGTIKRLTEIEKVRRQQATKCAEFCAAARKKNPKVPPIVLMVILTESSDASSILRPLGESDDLPTKLVEVGHKGKSVGLVGVYRDGKGFRLAYQPVPMGPEWKTTKEKEKGHPVIALFEEYHQHLQRENMLAKYPRTLHFNQLPALNQKGLKATYVGSNRCIDCHEHAGEVWKREKSKDKKHHALATETLEKLKAPAGRQYDPECMKCHTTGFTHPGGYNDFVPKLADWPNRPKKAPRADKIKEHNKVLRGVGCETCHGPGSEHVKNPDNKDVRDLINPFRASAEERQLVAAIEKSPKDAKAKDALRNLFTNQKRGLNLFCMKCHDSENDVNWGGPGHELFDKWIGKKMYHHTKRNNNGGAIPGPVKKGNAPAVLEPPRITIEVLEEKKK